jgi:hypothetical protein
MKISACHKLSGEVTKRKFRQVCHSHIWAMNHSKLYSITTENWCGARTAQRAIPICIALFRICQYICTDVLCFDTILSLPTGAYPPTDGYAETIYCSTLGLNIMFGHMYDEILNRAMHMQRMHMIPKYLKYVKT